MDFADLEMVLGWAAEEGWNPGVGDASAFLAADPEGFFLAEVNGAPAAAISVVNHDAKHAFLGLYICRPEFRGQGHGFGLWQAALAHAGARSVSLDGVPDQQANYAKSGFKNVGKTVRYRGVLPCDGHVSLATGEMLDKLVDVDAVTVGHERRAFATEWFRGSGTRQTCLLDDAGDRPAFATFRTCVEGTKVGPLHAANPDQVMRLLAGRPAIFEGPLYIDVPAQSPELSALLTRLSFHSTFETARMVRGTPALQELPSFYAVATLELG